MSKFICLVCIVSLRIVFQSANPQKDTDPFASPRPADSFIQTSSFPAFTASVSPAKRISVNERNNDLYVIPNHSDTEKETTVVIEVEKNADNKSFTRTAFIFETEKPESDFYRYFKKAD